MTYDNKRTAGLLFFVGSVQFVLAIIVSEAIYSGYSVGQQYVSDLGDWVLAGNSAAIFNVSIILMGIFVAAGAYFIQRVFNNKLFTSLLVMIAIGGVGVGFVAENVFLPIHSLFAVVAMLFGVASAFMSYRFEKSPFSYISVILGTVMLVSFILFSLGAYVNSDFYLGLGLGGMERFVIYPLLLWLLGFGAYLMNNSSDAPTTSKT
jgi:hypothetical membrane protein